MSDENIEKLLKLDQYNVRDATLRSLLMVTQIFMVESPSKEQQEQLGEVADALEARVQDEIDKSQKAYATTVEDDPFEDLDVGGKHIGHVVKYGDTIASVVVDGLIFGKLCNEAVSYDDAGHILTYCIKRWGHLNVIHEDEEGNERLTP